MRDPDSILVLTPHEEPDCFTVSPVLRNLPQMDEFVVQWDYPMMRLAPELNPEALRRPQARKKVCTDKEFTEVAVGSAGKAFGTVLRDAAQELQMSTRTAARYLARLTKAGLLTQSGGLYWVKRSAGGAP